MLSWEKKVEAHELHLYAKNCSATGEDAL
jgi:hypothetical protein